jgi:hypothetical protein
MRDELGALKREVFYRLMDLAGRVFVLVRHSDGVQMGRRGFTDAEKERGLVLVFNKKMKCAWDEAGIHASLSFSSALEKCFIPHEDILAVYSPELKIQLSSEPQEVETGGKGLKGREGADEGVGTPPARKKDPEEEGNIIRVDFGQREEDEPA